MKAIAGRHFLDADEADLADDEVVGLSMDNPASFGGLSIGFYFLARSEAGGNSF